MRHAVCAVVGLISLWSAANAATVSYTTAITHDYSPDDGDRIMVFTNSFDSSLGTLTAVSYTVFGDEIDRIIGENGDRTVFPATFHNYIDVYGNGFIAGGQYSQTDGYATTLAATSNFGLNYTVTNTNDLATYEDPGSIEVEFVAYSTVYKDGTFVGYSDDTATFGGSITESFTYTPVPEPASFAVLGVGLLSLATAFRRKLRV